MNRIINQLAPVTLALGVGAAACAQCPPGTFNYGPVWPEPDVEQIVLDHYGAAGPLVALTEDYERAAQDVSLIRAAIPSLVGEFHNSFLMTDQFIVRTLEPNHPELVCANTYYAAKMSQISATGWIVEFPRSVNIPAMVNVYLALPSVFDVDTLYWAIIGCQIPDRWLYHALPDGTWRWLIHDWDKPRACTAHATWTVDVSASGAVTPACYADCNADGVLTIADFACYQTLFATGAAFADCDGNYYWVSVEDFACFQTQFAAGCP